MSVVSCRGAITPVGESSFMSSGTLEQDGRAGLRITELPVGKWTQDYKEFLDDLLKGDGTKAGQENLLKNYSEHHTGAFSFLTSSYSLPSSPSFFFFGRLSWLFFGTGGGANMSP